MHLTALMKESYFNQATNFIFPRGPQVLKFGDQQIIFSLISNIILNVRTVTNYIINLSNIITGNVKKSKHSTV